MQTQNYRLWITYAIHFPCQFETASISIVWTRYNVFIFIEIAKINSADGIKHTSWFGKTAGLFRHRGDKVTAYHHMWRYFINSLVYASNIWDIVRY